MIGSVGAVVESPQFFPAFSGRRNLSLLAGVAGVSEARVGEVLELVGLTARASDRYATYSLRMKQRLGIAATMLKRPAVLILDEPTNGLDPAGIRDVRNTIRQLAEGGTTVLLSSHLLAEVEQVCDSVTIVARGRHIRSGSVREVLAGASAGRMLVRVDDLDGARAALVRNGFDVTPATDHLLVAGVNDAAAVTRTLAAAGLYLRALTPVGPALESVFLSLTDDETPAAVPTTLAVVPLVDLDLGERSAPVSFSGS